VLVSAGAMSLASLPHLAQQTSSFAEAASGAEVQLQSSLLCALWVPAILILTEHR
jgi:hypothetical protein